MSIKKKSNFPPIIIFIFISLHLISFCIDDKPILLMDFKTKSLRDLDDPNDYIEEYWYYDGDGNLIKRETTVYNTTIFLNKWFYNGIYHTISIGGKNLNSYINLGNPKFSVGKCHKNKIYSLLSNHYKPSESLTYSQIENNIGNDLLNFISDTSNYSIKRNIGEKKGEGINFYYNETNEDSLCGELGLNLNLGFDKTNLISQLKTKNYIEKFVWTLVYQNEGSGIIIIGNEPHFYDSKTYLMSQYCSVYANPIQSSETGWSFKFDDIYFYNKNKEKISLSQNKVNFAIDKGIIIGTDEYRKKIGDNFLNDLINNRICFIETKTFNDEEKNEKEQFYIYYCQKSQFAGKGLDDLEDTHYNNFPALKLYLLDSNMTFTLDKHDLFVEKFDRIYFLVIFRKSDNENNIWELGEPFFYKTRNNPVIFDQDDKKIGFYNFNLPKIPNEEYNNNNNKKSKEEEKTTNNFILYLGIGICIIILVVLALYFGKFFNEKRKKRANELTDDFDYSSDKPFNSNETNKEENGGNLGI